jgi:hypothetical protein
MSFANEIKKRGTRYRNQEEISRRGNAERAAMFTERHEITEVFSFWGFIFTECLCCEQLYYLAIQVMSDTRVRITHGMFCLYDHRDRYHSLSST